MSSWQRRRSGDRSCSRAGPSSALLRNGRIRNVDGAPGVVRAHLPQLADHEAKKRVVCAAHEPQILDGRRPSKREGSGEMHLEKTSRSATLLLRANERALPGVARKHTRAGHREEHTAPPLPLPLRSASGNPLLNNARPLYALRRPGLHLSDRSGDCCRTARLCGSHRRSARLGSGHRSIARLGSHHLTTPRRRGPRTGRFPPDSPLCEALLQSLLEQDIQRKLDDARKISIRHAMPQELLELLQPIMHLLPHTELQLVAAGAQWHASRAST